MTTESLFKFLSATLKCTRISHVAFSLFVENVKFNEVVNLLNLMIGNFAASSYLDSDWKKFTFHNNVVVGVWQNVYGTIVVDVYHTR